MQLIKVDGPEKVEPVEVMDATFAEVRVCLFLDVDEHGSDQWSFEMQERETGSTASMRYYDAWKVVFPSSVGLEPSYCTGIGDMSEAVTRAALALARLVEHALTEH